MSLRVGRKDIGVGKLIKHRKKFSDNDLKQRRIIRKSFIKRYYDEEDVDYPEVGEAAEEDPEEEEEDPEDEEAVEQYIEDVEGGEEKEALAAAFGGLSLERRRRRRRRKSSGAGGGVVIINDDYRKKMESIRGKFTKEQVDKVKLTPWEYLDVPIPPEEKDYHETNFKYIGISIDAKEFIQKYVSQCYITDTESKTLSQAMKDSKGFDLPSLPNRAFMAAMVTPMYLVNNDDAEKMAKYSKLAVRHYNKTHDTRYVFKQLVKANLQTACGLLFRVTFMAMNAHPPNYLETFQAEIFEKIGDDIEILLCRIKPRK